MRSEDAPHAGSGGAVQSRLLAAGATARAAGEGDFRAVAKSLLLGAAGAKLLLTLPTAWWESSAHRAMTTLLFDAAWAVGLTGVPSLIGWRAAAAWKGAAIIALVALGGGVLVCAMRTQVFAIDTVDLALRFARLAAVSVTAVGVLAMTGAWLVVAPRR